ncbi:hypothetical protein IPH92_02630 [Candidatus Kaiserbacteria bacterium]|nr:MAG: hypothetical protein IPH92_02630 [Candidatus Kaiserbacteria bacterium]
MKKIIMSLGMIVFVGALVAGGTGAFFSDTETSTGNLFTAGAIDLKVDSEQHYNNAVCTNGVWVLDDGETEDNPQYPVLNSPCTGTWLPANLGAQTFFNFTDIKPGDEGENTISLHVDNNDAYACVDVSLVANDDVSTVEPELGAGDAVNTGSLFDGELAQNIEFFAWADYGATPGFQGTDPGEGDNIWQANEQPLFSNGSGPASDVLDGESYTIASPILGALVGGSTSYVGLAWCAGDLTTPVAGTIACNGGAMGNIAQTDSMVANIAFRVEQARNNPNFTCGDIPPALDLVFSESFEQQGDPYWFSNDGTFSIVNSGTGGVTSSDGNKHGLANGDIFTRWGGYSSVFPAGGYTTEVDVYLDMADADGIDKRFDFSSASNGSDGNHQRDFIFHLGTNAVGVWAANASNNAPGDPHGVGTVAINTTGWYTLQAYFHDVAGVLVVDMKVLNSLGVVVGSWTRSDPSDTIPAEVGGNRYGWFINNPFTDLPFDNARLYLGAPAI